MANRMNRKNNNNNMGSQRRTMGYNNYNRDNFDRPRYNVNPWQGGMMPNSSGIGPAPGTEATLALANNIINNFLQTRPNTMPSLLDLNVRRDMGPNFMRDERYGPNKMYGRNMQMGGQMNRRVMSGGRNDRMMNKVRRPMRPNVNNKAKSVPKPNQETKKEPSESKAETVVKSEQPAVQTEEIPEAEQPAAAVEEENGDATQEKQETKKPEGVKTEFDDIASKYLECHICEKRMWDGRSFDNHIKGRVHNIMMDKTKQSYHMTADAMRQELKIHEMKRSKRGFVPGSKRVFCAMCDLYVFYAAAHRRSPGHQKLKKYLHPSCNTCRKEFPTRIELDEHRLTAPHLRLLQEKQKDVQARSKPEVVMITTLQEELAQVRPMHEMKSKKGADAKKENADNEENSQEDTEENKEDSEMKSDAKVDTDECMDEEKVLLLDYKEGDDLTDMTRENLPRYQTDRPVGISYISDFTCKQCTLCKKYFDTEETAEVHLRTWKHFQAYIRLIHSKGNFKANNQDSANAKRDLNESSGENDGTWKRRKIEKDDDDNTENEELLNGNDSVNEDSANEENNETKDDSLYDPSVIADDIIEENEVKIEEVPVEPVVVPQVVIKSSPRGRGRGRGARARRGSRN